MKKVIERLIRLPSDRWHHITVRMSWFYRTNGMGEIPAMILAANKGKAPTQGEWIKLRKVVAAGRRAVREDERRITAQRKVEKRRAYMREYMQSYRQRNNRAVG